MSADDPLPPVSVVVCSRNGADTLDRALRSLHKQSQGSPLREIIVVDDGSSDGTAEVAQACAAKVVRLGINQGLAAARNAGVAVAQGPVVAFTDDDCEADPGWVTAISRALVDLEVSGVSGPVETACQSGFVARYLSAYNPLSAMGREILDGASPRQRIGRYARAALRPTTPARELYSVVGANMAFRRNALLEAGGFDEAFTFGAEEEELCRRLHAESPSTKLLFVPDAKVKHWFRAELSDCMRRSRGYGRGNGRTILAHPEMRPIVFPIPVLVVLLFALGILTRRRNMTSIALGLPLIGYPRWVALIPAQRRPDPLSYPYLLVAQETMSMVGQIDGLRAGYSHRPARHLTAPLPAYVSVSAD